MILDTRFENKNFETTNKLMTFLGNFDYVIERNTKYHKVYSDKQKKETTFNLSMFYLLSDILFVYLFFNGFIQQKIFLTDYIGVTILLVLFFIVWLVFQIGDVLSISYGNSNAFKEVWTRVTVNEYLRYQELTIPIETMPDWFIGEDIVYSKESFNQVLLGLKKKQPKELLNKYKKLAFKTNKIIANNKKLLTAYLKQEQEQLVILKDYRELD